MSRIQIRSHESAPTNIFENPNKDCTTKLFAVARGCSDGLQANITLKFTYPKDCSEDPFVRLMVTYANDVYKQFVKMLSENKKPVPEENALVPSLEEPKSPSPLKQVESNHRLSKSAKKKKRKFSLQHSEEQE